MKIHSDYPAVIFISFLAVALFFFPALFQNSRSIQWDTLELHYPHLAFFSRSIQNGTVPLWEPHIYCGYPFIGYLQSGAFYPVNFLISLFRIITPRIMICLTVFCYFSALCGVYFLIRLFGISRAGSAFAAITWVFSGQLLGHATHLGIIQFYALFPWVLLLAGIGFFNRSYHHILLSAVLLGWSILAGHFQTGVYSVMFWLIWVSTGCITSVLSKKSRIIPSLIILASAVFLCLSTTGIQLFTTADLALQSPRKDISAALSETESFQPASLITVFLPDFFGGINGLYTGPWSRTNQQCHAGFITPFFWLAALLSTPFLLSVRQSSSRKRSSTGPLCFDRSRRSLLLFLWIWIIMGFLYALGPRTPVHKTLMSIIPGWNLVRTPAAILPLVFLSLSVFSGIGFDSFLGRLPRRTGKCLALCIPFLTFLQLLILYRNSDLMFGKQAPYTHFLQTSHRDFLDARYADDTAGFRIHEWDIKRVLLTNESSWKGWYQTGGRISGLHIRKLGELLRLAEFNKTITDVLRARYILVSDKPSDTFVVSTTRLPPGASSWNPRLELETVSPGILYNPDAQPYLFPVTSWIVCAQDSDMPDLIVRTDMNRAVLLHEEPELDIEDIPVVFDFSVRSIGLHRLEFDYSLNTPALLVTGDTWTPEWRAYIDGDPVRLLRANHALRAVAAPAGTRSLIMTFHSPGYLLGAFCSLLSLLVSIAIIVYLAGPDVRT
jgi:hypothetical protein